MKQREVPWYLVLKEDMVLKIDGRIEQNFGFEEVKEGREGF